MLEGKGIVKIYGNLLLLRSPAFVPAAFDPAAFDPAAFACVSILIALRQEALIQICKEKEEDNRRCR
jgi:hypothetical protein